MMTLRDLINLPNVSLDSKIYVYLDEYCTLCHVTYDPELVSKDIVCLVPTAEEDED